MKSEAPLARPPVALVVSEHEWSMLSLESVLGPNGYAVVRTFNGRQAIERVTAVSPDLVFIDSRLPDMEGVQLCRALRTHPGTSPAMPIFLVTADHVSRAEQLGALRAGAWEYIRLPTDAEELLLRLESYVRGKFEADRAREESLLDYATGLYSMRGVFKRARELASESVRHGRPLACIVVAPETSLTTLLDGTGPSDSALRDIAALFLAASRASDAVGRLGPNEFVILAPETTREGARQMAKRLVDAVEAYNSTRAKDDLLRIRVGCCAVDDFRDSMVEPIEMLTRASMALRQSKGDERGIFVYEPSSTVN